MSGLFESLKEKFSSSPLFKSKHTHRMDSFEKSVQQSFNNLRKDMEHISKLLHHFNTTNQKQVKDIHSIEKRLYLLEHSLSKASGKLVESEEIEEAAEGASSDEQDEAMWDTLTETQQKLCWKLAVLQKEMPGQWISLKYLAQELYPDKEYGFIRSTLSQFVSALEEMGFVKRKRKGKQAYIISTDKNPCLKKKMPVVEFEKARIRK